MIWSDDELEELVPLVSWPLRNEVFELTMKRWEGGGGAFLFKLKYADGVDETKLDVHLKDNPEAKTLTLCIYVPFFVQKFYTVEIPLRRLREEVEGCFEVKGFANGLLVLVTCKGATVPPFSVELFDELVVDVEGGPAGSGPGPAALGGGVNVDMAENGAEEDVLDTMDELPQATRADPDVHLEDAVNLIPLDVDGVDRVVGAPAPALEDILPVPVPVGADPVIPRTFEDIINALSGNIPTPLPNLPIAGLPGADVPIADVPIADLPVTPVPDPLPKGPTENFEVLGHLIVFKIGVYEPFPLLSLPPELQYRLISLFSLQDVIRFSSTSNSMRQIVENNNVIWEHQLYLYFGVVPRHLRTHYLDLMSVIFFDYKFQSNSKTLFRDLYQFMRNWHQLPRCPKNVWPKNNMQRILAITDIFHCFSLTGSKSFNYDFSNDHIGELVTNDNEEGNRNMWHKTGVYSKYVVYGALFLLLEQTPIHVKDNALVVEVNPKPPYLDRNLNFIFNHFSSLCTLLTSSNVFGNNMSFKKDLFAKLANFGELLGKGGYSNSTDTMLLFLKVAAMLDETLTSDRQKKEEIKAKALKQILENTTDNPHDHPVTYYNTACIYSLFKDFEQSKKYFQWCFNYKDGEFKEHPRWGYSDIFQLVQVAAGDCDLDNVREEPWFTETLHNAEVELEKDKPRAWHFLDDLFN